MSRKARWPMAFLVVAGACSHEAGKDAELPHKADQDRGTNHAILRPANPDNDPEATSADNHHESNGELKPPSDARCRELVLGTWMDEYQGRRTMIVRSDGTATMIVELEGWNATLYADRLTFEEEWSIDGGRFKLLAVGGEPEVRVNLILATMGNSSNLKILDLTNDRMLLLDADGTTKYDWRRAHHE